MGIEEFNVLCLQYSNDLIGLHRPNSTFLRVSPNCEKILGYTESELTLINPYEIIHEDDKKTIEQQGHLPLLSGNYETFVESRLRTKHGAYKWFETRGIPLKNPHGEVQFLLSVSRDITELKTHLEKIYQNEIMLEEAGKLARIGAWELDLETMTPYWSKTTYDIHEVEYGVMPNFDEAINFYAVEARPIVTQAITNAIEKGIPYDLKLQFITAKNNKIWVRAIGRPEIRFGRTVKLYGIFRDIDKEVEQENQQKALIEQLTNQRNQLQEYNQIVSHNIRSPVASLNSLIHFIEKTDNKQEREKLIGDLKQVTLSLNTLLDELVDAVKIINNNELVYEDIDVKEVVKKTEKMLEGSILEHKAEIKLNLEKWQVINFPRLYFESIVLNLLSNALKYHSPQRIPEIWIIAGAEGGRKTLSFSDNGLGIDLKRYKDKIFKLHKTFHRNRPGKGLGLFMTKNQVQAAGGDITVESEPDKGTIFKIIFNTKLIQP